MARISLFVCLFLLLEASPANADQVRYLARPDQSLTAFMTLADQAQRSIDLATFIFDPCHASTQLLMEKLEARAKAGVKVRVLLDASGHEKKQKTELANFFNRYGMELRWYNDYSVYGFHMNLRMHVKLFNVDGTTYISGGRNISDEYFGMSTKQNWIDRDVMVTGASARDATANFEEIWRSNMTAKTKAAAFKGWTCVASPARPLAMLRSYLERNPSQHLGAPARECSRVSFTADSPEFGNPKYGNDRTDDSYGSTDYYMTPIRLHYKRATAQVLDFIQGTRRKLEMENWGYLPYGLLSDAIGEVRDRRIPIRVATNEDMEAGPDFFKEAEEYAIRVTSTDHSVGSQKVTLVSSKGALSEFNAYELTPPKAVFFLHGKVIVRDQRDAIVSSFNLDGRSYSTNLESVVTMHDCPEIAADIQARTDEVHGINRTDRAQGRIPAKKAPSFFAKWFAMVTFSSL